MIKAVILHNKEGMTVGFSVKCHGEPIVCSAVSMLAINTINSIQLLAKITEDNFHCKLKKGGGHILFVLKCSSLRDTGAGILLDALVLGLSSVSEYFPNDIKLSSKPIRK